MTFLAVMGVDIGTTGVRAVIYRENGAVISSQTMNYALYTPQAAWAEQDPEEIFAATVKVIRDSMQEAHGSSAKIAGLCFSSVMHSLLPVDTAGVPLHPMLIWADSRAQKILERLPTSIAGNIYTKTGCPLHPMYPLYKILWFKEDCPETFAKAAKFISIKEFIWHRLTGDYLVDKSIASATSIYNLHTLDWDEDLLRLLGISAEKLSKVVPTTHIHQGMIPSIAKELGLPADIALIIGASDGILSSIGSGAVNPGQITAMVGTSGAVRVVTDKPKIDPKMRTWCYNMTEKYWVLGGAINNGGIALRWVRDQFADAEQQVAKNLGLNTYDVLSRFAQQIPAGTDGLLMLPFFSGERAPYWNANARGILFGLNLNHGKGHLIRATLEGVIYCMYSVFQSLEEVTGDSNEIRVSGSFTRSRLWVQIMADVFGRVIKVPGEPQGSAFGAAVLGMHALGILPDIHGVGNLMTIKETYFPCEINHRKYQQLYTIYDRIYWNLQQEFQAIAEIQRSWQSNDRDNRRN